MAYFGTASTKRLATCDEKLQRVFQRVVQTIDCTILKGHRNKEEQDAAFASGNSQLKWPNGKHNKLPSKAVDVIPYPIDWDDRERMTLFAGFVLGVAEEMGVRLRWGGDWNMNWEVGDNDFDDLVHFELLN